MENPADSTRYGIVQLTDMPFQYENWAYRMKLLLGSKKLIRYTKLDNIKNILTFEHKSDEDKKQIKEDAITQNLIVQHLGSPYIKLFEEKNTAFLLWNKIKKHFSDGSEGSVDSVTAHRGSSSESPSEESDSVFRKTPASSFEDPDQDVQIESTGSVSSMSVDDPDQTPAPVTSSITPSSFSGSVTSKTPLAYIDSASIDEVDPDPQCTVASNAPKAPIATFDDDGQKMEVARNTSESEMEVARNTSESEMEVTRNTSSISEMELASTTPSEMEVASNTPLSSVSSVLLDEDNPVSLRTVPSKAPEAPIATFDDDNQEMEVDDDGNVMPIGKDRKKLQKKESME